MAFQLGAFQTQGFQTPLHNQRPSGGYGQAWITYGDGPERFKRVVNIDRDDDILAIVKAFIDNVLTQ